MKNLRKNSRRSFVKKSALATGVVLANPFFSEAMVNSSSEKKLKISVIGCGGRGSGAAVQALKADKNVELVSMADAFRDRIDKSLKGIIDSFEGQKNINVKEKNKFVGFDAYKKAIDKSDVVILATPPGFRPYHFEYAIKNNKHVFMEKPLATDPAGVRKVLEYAKVAKQKKLNVVVGLQRHYQTKYLEFKKLVDSGKIGKIIGGQVYWNDGGVWTNKRQPNQTELEYQMRNWYYFNWLCGDHILEQHIHNIDVANWFIGEYPVSAQGMGGRQVRNGKEHGEIYDHHFVEFTYPSGAVISSQCRHQKGCMNRVEEVFQGTKGNLRMNNNNFSSINLYSGKTVYQHVDQGDDNPYQVEHNLLFKAVKSGMYQFDDAIHGANSTMTAILGRMATYSGQLLTWDQAMASDLNLVPDLNSFNDLAPVVPDSDGHYPVPVPGVTRFT